ncbi:tyrosine-type recombinase/integrase [Microtetraspora sp. NBRC 16547]|uniref:tyrosine-type recombinase/integrase n=1 Tax=Microtetraspora sp. NBRC 16547 TaxID=3030993 RepID=UPI00255489BF|nr:tyrosine-type recombinase/integrase [Microtetraspora sp. NBRC 16547]
MGFSRKRLGIKGKPRYTAYYTDLRGRELSAGTFSSKKEADKAWQQAEAKVAEGRAGDPARSKQSFRRYVEEEWLPHHLMEATTREGYTYSIYAHIMKWFGPMRMIEILPSDVRAWVKDQQDCGLSPATIRLNKSILSGIFTTALNDQVTVLHPCKGVKTPTVPKKPLRIVSPEEFDQLYFALPDEETRLLAETAIESGMRWGELTELRVKDLELINCIVTVSRTVVEINPKHHPEGKRFLIKEYPKDREFRRFKLTPQIAAKLKQYIKDNKLERDDLLFVYRPEEPAPQSQAQPVEHLGLTEPNAAGRRYRHGTLSAYAAGKCRCRHCKNAYAVYRAERRAAGKDGPRHARQWDTDGHIPRRWFRDQVWRPALAASGLEFKVKMHDLRHAHASWLLAGGADLQVVKERLGHGSISTTEKYLHTLPDADQTALDALARTRSRSRR